MPKYPINKNTKKGDSPEPATPESEDIETRRAAAKDRRTGRLHNPYAGLKGPALQKLRNVGVVGSHDTGLENDPEIEAGITEDDRATQELADNLDVDKTMDEALEDVGQDGGPLNYPIGNGSTLPYPYDGEQTTDVATCSASKAGENRGCGYHTVRGRHYCPLGTGNPIAEKYSYEGGSANLVYKDLRSGRVKTCHCTSMMSTYLKMPNIVLLPVDWYPTRLASYAPLPNGQQPMPGPGQPRTRINLTPHKTIIGNVPPPELVSEFQKMRRRGDFEPRQTRAKSRRRR